MAAERKKKYKELSSHIERERQLGIVVQKMEMKRHLMVRSGVEDRFCLVGADC